MFVLISGLLLLSSVVARAEAITQLQHSYERFFTSRYALEQEFPFRLISVRERMIALQPHTNVLKPLVTLSAADLVHTEKINALLMQSFMPLLYGVTGGDGNNDALVLIRQLVSEALQYLRTISRQQLDALLRNMPDRKLTYTLFLAPYRKTDADLYYGEQKISMVRNGQVSLRADDYRDAQQHITKEINNYRAFLFYHHKQQAMPTPLAARLHFTIDAQQALLTADLLLNLYPRTIPYKKKREGVSFHSLVVPAAHRFRFPVALLSVHTPLNLSTPPQLRISFGNFHKLDQRRFLLANEHHYQPYLAGHLQQFSPVQLKFRFQNITLSLATLQAEQVHTVFSPGFRLGALQVADFGNFRVEKIDRKFKTAINQKITAAKDKLLNETLTAPNIAAFISEQAADALRKLLSHNSAEETAP